MTLCKLKCPQSGIPLIDIPVRLYFKNTVGILQRLTKAYKKSLECMPIKHIKIPRDNATLPGELSF